MSIPTGEKPKDPDWAVSTRAPYEVMDAAPAGGDLWTDHRDYGRRLTKRQEHPQAQRVRVVEPLVPHQAARITEREGVYEARRA